MADGCTLRVRYTLPVSSSGKHQPISCAVGIVIWSWLTSTVDVTDAVDGT